MQSMQIQYRNKVLTGIEFGYPQPFDHWLIKFRLFRKNSLIGS